MERSPEIEQLIRDMVDALNQADVERVEHMLSHEQGVVMIGTSPDEYSRTQAAIHQLLEDSTPEAAFPIHVSVDEVCGYEEGDVAWADCTGTLKRDNEVVAIRYTEVLHREQGEWRSVQSHSSMADLIVGVARQSIAGRKPFQSWYGQYLCQHATAMGRDLDISASALALLQARDPKDRRGIGWSRAKLAR